MMAAPWGLTARMRAGGVDQAGLRQGVGTDRYSDPGSSNAVSFGTDGLTWHPHVVTGTIFV